MEVSNIENSSDEELVEMAKRDRYSEIFLI